MAKTNDLRFRQDPEWAYRSSGFKITRQQANAAIKRLPTGHYGKALKRYLNGKDVADGYSFHDRKDGTWLVVHSSWRAHAFRLPGAPATRLRNLRTLVESW